MARIPENYLPPRNTWPRYVVPEEFADTPDSLNLADYLLDRHIREGRGDYPAIKFMDSVITYAQLQLEVNKFGNALRSSGVEPRDRVGLRVINTPRAVSAVFAIAKLGAIPVPVSPLWSAEELAFVVNNSEMRHFINDAALVDSVARARSQFDRKAKVIVIGGKPTEVKAAGNLVFEEMVENGAPQLDAVMLDGRDIGLILYTSGTTGMPKGCVHFLKSTVIESRLVNRHVYKLRPGDVLGGAAPVSFAAGFGTFLLLPFEGGAAISLIPRFTPADMMELIQKHAITVLTGLPTAYRALMKFPEFKQYDISSVRLYTSGGDALGDKTLEGWINLTGLPIWEGLGGTEMLHLVTSNTMNPAPVPNSIGKALPGVEVRVVDPEGNECRPGEIGSLRVRGASGTLYWKPHEDNGKLLGAQERGVVDGWNQMGDAVKMDESGNIFFISREDDMIKSSGYRISPAEVEEAILRHPAVADVAVIGVPDSEKGQVTKAFVVLKPAQKDRAGDKFFEELKTLLKEHIAVYKLPRLIGYLEALPRTPTGKLLRRKLRS
jgi:2-aminobenzoate-CoA ligase